MRFGDHGRVLMPLEIIGPGSDQFVNFVAEHARTQRPRGDPARYQYA